MPPEDGEIRLWLARMIEPVGSGQDSSLGHTIILIDRQLTPGWL